jgi:hypothetical protein
VQQSILRSFEGVLAPIDGTKWEQGLQVLLRRHEGARRRRDSSDAKPTGFSESIFRLQHPAPGDPRQHAFRDERYGDRRRRARRKQRDRLPEHSISGTTGVLPEKSIAKPVPPNNLLTKFFPQAASAISQASNSIKRAVDSVTGGGNKSTPEPDPATTGYFQFWNMHNFLLAYADLKTNKDAGSYRLVFGMPKDGLEYIVTPVSFDLRKDASNPLLYRYAIALKAWGINTKLRGEEVRITGLPSPRNVSAVKALVNSLRSTRDAVSASRGVVAGVQSDLGEVMQVYNQAVLALKEVVGLGADVAEFGPVLKNNAELIIASANSALRDEVARFGSKVAAPPYESAQGVSGTGVSGESGKKSPSTSSLYANHFKNALDDPSFASKPLSDFGTLPPSVSAQISDVFDSATKTTSKQVRTLASKLQQAVDNLSSATSAMDATYAKTYSVPVGTASRQATSDDIILMAQMMDAKNGFISSLATGQLFREREVDPFALARQSLDQADSISTPLSAYAVAVDKGATMDGMALKYLADASRGREIALLNGLRAPYIDEDGSVKPITGADGRTFMTAFPDSYAVGQRIQIRGTGVASTYRRVIGIQNLGGGSSRVTVDGPDNLSLFAPSTNPQAWARALGTVGSGDTILIPDGRAPQAQATRPTAALAALSQAEKIFGIDLELDPSGDLGKGADGDLSRISGYPNGAQALKILAETRQGELSAHPGYGLKIAVGNPNYTASDLTSELEAQIRADGRFQSSDVSVVVEGSKVTTKIEAQGAGGSGLIPLAFEVGALPQ